MPNNLKYSAMLELSQVSDIESPLETESIEHSIADAAASLCGIIDRYEVGDYVDDPKFFSYWPHLYRILSETQILNRMAMNNFLDNFQKALSTEFNHSPVPLDSIHAARINPTPYIVEERSWIMAIQSLGFNAMGFNDSNVSISILDIGVITWATIFHELFSRKKNRGQYIDRGFDMEGVTEHINPTFFSDVFDSLVYFNSEYPKFPLNPAIETVWMRNYIMMSAIYRFAPDSFVPRHYKRILHERFPQIDSSIENLTSKSKMYQCMYSEYSRLCGESDEPITRIKNLLSNIATIDNKKA